VVSGVSVAAVVQVCFALLWVYELNARVHILARAVHYVPIDRQRAKNGDRNRWLSCTVGGRQALELDGWL
jgi:hypothetical protein